MNRIWKSFTSSRVRREIGGREGAFFGFLVGEERNRPWGRWIKKILETKLEFPFICECGWSRLSVNLKLSPSSFPFSSFFHSHILWLWICHRASIINYVCIEKTRQKILCTSFHRSHSPVSSTGRHTIHNSQLTILFLLFFYLWGTHTKLNSGLSRKGLFLEPLAL